MIDQRLLTLIGTLSDPGDRPRVAKKLAQALGAEDLLVFSEDPSLKILLPAPGFPQTLPKGREWREYLSDVRRERHLERILPSPYTETETLVCGVAAPEGSVLTLLGGIPDAVRLLEISPLIPLLVAAFYNERIALIARGEAETESMTARRAHTLNEALDSSRRSLESALRKSTSILESITDAFFSLDKDWRFTELNAQAEELLGKRRGQLLGNVLWDLYPEATNSTFDLKYREAVLSRRKVRFEEFFPLREAWYEVRVYPTRDGLAVYFSDIDEQKRAAEALKESQEWFRTTLESIGDAVVAVNTDGSISFLNPVAESLTGWELKEAIGKPVEGVFRIISEESRQPAPSPVARALVERKTAGLKKHRILVSRTGHEYVIEESASPILNSDGEITGVVLVFRDSTEEHSRNRRLQNAYAELKLERSRLESILRQMPEGVIIAEPSGKIILRNDQMDRMLGGFLHCESMEEFGQYKGARSDGSPYRAQDWPLSRSLRHGETVLSEEVTVERIGGGSVVLSISSAPIRDENEKIVAGVVIHHDITESKRLEADLKYQNQLTRTITDNAASCLFMLDVRGHPTFMNPAAMQVTGYTSLDEIKDRPLHYAIHWKKPDGSDYPMEECPIDNAQATLKIARNQEEIFSRKDGSLFPVSYSVTPLEQNGKVIGSVLEFRDISAQKDTEQQLKRAIVERDQSVETLSTINSVGQKLTAELDLEKLVQQVTDAATRLSGAQFGALFYSVLNEDGQAYTLYTISGVDKAAFSNFPMPRATAVFHPTFMGEGTVRSNDITQDPRYGKNAPFHGMPKGHLPVRSYLAVPVLSRGGEVMGGLFFGHEKPGVFSEHAEKIVEGLAAQAAVAMDNARLYQRAVESVRARDEFLSIASHELKTPLTSLRLQAQLRSRKLMKGTPDSLSEANLKKMLEVDTRQIDRLSRLVDDMLDISRIATGKLTILKEEFDLCELVSDILERFRPQFQAANCEIQLVCCNPVHGEWDRFRIEQIVTNLFTNAVRYGNGKPIEVSVTSRGNKAILAVKDSGIGIAKENHTRIFERFERAVSANDISGLGLGLYIVKQIVEIHRGTIRVESAPGRGATFTVELPMRAENES